MNYLNQIFDGPNNLVVFSLDNTYRYVYFNKNHFNTIKGIWGEEIKLGQSMLDVIGKEEDRSKAKENFDRALRGETFTLEEEYGDVKLNRTLYENYYAPFFNDQGVIAGVTVLVTDKTPQLNIQKDLQKSAHLLKVSQKISHLGHWLWETDSEHIEWSEETYRIFGYEPYAVEVDLSLFFDSIIEEDRDRIIELKNLSLVSGAMPSIQTKIRRPNNQVRHIKLQSDVMEKNTGGFPVTIVGTVQDITEKKQSEIALLENEQKYKFLAEKTSDVVVLWDQDFNFQYISPSVEKVFGYTVKEYKSFKATENIYKEDIPIVEGIIDKINNGFDDFESEYRFYTKSGQIIWLLTRTKVIRDDKGNMVNTITASSDISERKKAELALKESEERYRLLTEAAPVGIMVQTGGKVTYINPFGLSLLEAQNLEDIKGNDVMKYVHPCNYDNTTERLKKLYSKALNYAEPIEEILITEQNNARDMMVSGISINYNGQTAVCNVFHDISNIKEAQRQLEKALKEKNTLFKELHHRIKNNLQLVSSLLIIKSQSTNNVELKNFINETSARIQTMSGIHDQLLKLEEIDQLNTKEYIEELAGHLLERYSTNPKLYNLNLKVENHNLHIDRILTLGLLINEIVSNAIKYAYPQEQGGEISISLKKNANSFNLLISDFGQGFSSEQLSKENQSLGIWLIELFCLQLKGCLHYNLNHGVEFSVEFPA